MPSFGISLICTQINGWVNNREAGDLRRNHAHYDVTVMMSQCDKPNTMAASMVGNLHQLGSEEIRQCYVDASTLLGIGY